MQDASEAAIEKDIQAAGKTAPRITPAAVDETILSTHYVDGNSILDNTPIGEAHGVFPTTRQALPLLTLCVLVLKNGFTVVGKSACASPENFDQAIGRKLAFADARQQIWALEGYRLRSELARAGGAS
jgi:hypothetical protein